MNMETWEKNAFAYGRQEMLDMREDGKEMPEDLDAWLNDVKYDWTTYNLPLTKKQMVSDIRDVLTPEMLQEFWFDAEGIEFYDMITNEDYLYVELNDKAFESVWAELTLFAEELWNGKHSKEIEALDRGITEEERKLLKSKLMLEWEYEKAESKEDMSICAQYVKDVEDELRVAKDYYDMMALAA